MNCDGGRDLRWLSSCFCLQPILQRILVGVNDTQPDLSGCLVVWLSSESPWVSIECGTLDVNFTSVAVDIIRDSLLWVSRHSLLPVGPNRVCVFSSFSSTRIS